MAINRLLFIVIILAAFLRFYQIASNPPGLYWDEAAMGYDAYSILKSARDHHGKFMPLFPESFGDWKMPVYIYTLIPSVAVFGLSEFSVRFPSALSGTLTVLVFFYLIKKLTKDSKLALLSALFLAISPWHIQFSRAAFEATIGLFFFSTALLLLLVGFEKPKSWYFTASFIFFVVSIYSYHAYRIFTPLFLIFLFYLFRKEVLVNLKKIILPAAVSFILLLPIISFSLSSQGRDRLTSQSAFDKDKAEKIRIDFDQSSKRPLRFLSGYIFPRESYWSYLTLNAYLDHFSPNFLFTSGDSIGRHSQVDMGQIFLFDGVLLSLAIFFLKKLNSNTKKVILLWLFIAPIPATFVVPTPHALRSLQMVIPLTFLMATGAYYIFKNARLVVNCAIVFIMIYSFANYLHLLFSHYPKKFSADWQDGYRQMVKILKTHQERFDKVYITDIYNVPYIYLLFYLKYEPAKFQMQNGSRFSFDKYVFVKRDTHVFEKGQILYVAPVWEKVDGIWLDSTYDRQRRPIYNLWEVRSEN